MMRYNLVCAKEHEFEGWFPSSAAYDTQRKKGQVRCPECGTRRVEKALMAPSVATGRKKEDARKALVARQVRQKLMEIRKHVEATGENVGREFATEARKIHYGDAEDRSIYGEATVQEAKELLEEGVDVLPLPAVDTTEN